MIKQLLLFIVYLGATTCYGQVIQAKNNQHERKIAQISSIVIQDKVYKMQNINNGIKVFFSQHAGIYYLLKTNPNYSAIFSELGKSLTSETEISLQVDATYLTIEKLIP